MRSPHWPKLGVVRHKGREFVLADIPGLIEGAADGAGIGDRFLGHIERCRVLIHLIDIAGEDPADAMRTVEEELAAYGEGLADKPRLVALNKLDLADAELAEAFAGELLEAGADEVFAVSGATGEGLERSTRCSAICRTRPRPKRRPDPRMRPTRQANGRRSSRAGWGQPHDDPVARRSGRPGSLSCWW